MNQQLFSILESEGIQLLASIALKDCEILRPYKLTKAGFSEGEELFATIFAIPYLTPAQNRNLSAYAVSRDYHIFFKQLFDTVIPKLEGAFPGYLFGGFADDSPINEREAAARAGLGIIGDNGLLITEKYSSYVFLGEIITNLPIECKIGEIRRCEGCGRCKKACPMVTHGECLSAITQKKGELTDEEKRLIIENGSVWGCDKCQECCPHTTNAIKNKTIYTDVEFFESNRISNLTKDILDGMTREEFASRAYSWRGKSVIARNLDILEKGD